MIWQTLLVVLIIVICFIFGKYNKSPKYFTIGLVLAIITIIAQHQIRKYFSNDVNVQTVIENEQPAKMLSHYVLEETPQFVENVQELIIAVGKSLVNNKLCNIPLQVESDADT